MLALISVPQFAVQLQYFYHFPSVVSRPYVRDSTPKFVSIPFQWTTEIGLVK